MSRSPTRRSRRSELTFPRLLTAVRGQPPDRAPHPFLPWSPMTNAPPDLTVLGQLSIDDVVLPDGRTDMGGCGGDATHAALSASLWVDHVGVVAPAGVRLSPHQLPPTLQVRPLLHLGR